MAAGILPRSVAHCLRWGRGVLGIYRRTESELPGGAKDRIRARQEGAPLPYLNQPIRLIEDIGIWLRLNVYARIGANPIAAAAAPYPFGFEFIIGTDTPSWRGLLADPTIGETTRVWKHYMGFDPGYPATMSTSHLGFLAGGDAVVGPAWCVGNGGRRKPPSDP